MSSRKCGAPLKDFVQGLFSVEGKEDKIKWSMGTLSHLLGQDTIPAPFLHSAV